MIIFSKFMRFFLLAAVLIGSLASSGGLFAQEERVDLSLRLLPDYYYREVVPGSSLTLFLEVRNNGNKALTNIRLNAAKLEGWVVEFKPDRISYLGAGSSQTVDVNIISDRNADRGEHTITLLAEANETRAATSTVLRVENGTSFWLWVGIGLAALVIAGFALVFLRFGKQ